MREERPAASTMAAIFTCSPGLAALHGGDLGDDRDGDLGGALRADIEADRRVNALDAGCSDARLKQPLDALGMGLFAAQRPDIERIGGKRGDQRRIVDLRVMGQRDQRRAAIHADLGQRLVGPVAYDLHIAEAFLGGEGRARIHDHHFIAKRAGHRHQRLRHMHGADDDQPHRRIEHVDEDLAVAPCERHALVAAKGIVQRRRQIRSHIARRMSKASRAGRKIA